MKNRYLSKSEGLIKYTGLIALTILLCSNAYTQERSRPQIIQGKKAQVTIPGAKYIEQSSNFLLPVTVRFDQNEKRTAAQFMGWMAEEINVHQKIELREEDSYTDPLGFTRRAFIQWYDDVEVDQAYYYVHSRKGQITMAMGKSSTFPSCKPNPH